MGRRLMSEILSIYNWVLWGIVLALVLGLGVCVGEESICMLCMVMAAWSTWSFVCGMMVDNKYPSISYLEGMVYAYTVAF